MPGVASKPQRKIVAANLLVSDVPDDRILRVTEAVEDALTDNCRGVQWL